MQTYHHAEVPAPMHPLGPWEERWAWGHPLPWEDHALSICLFHTSLLSCPLASEAHCGPPVGSLLIGAGLCVWQSSCVDLLTAKASGKFFKVARWSYILRVKRAGSNESAVKSLKMELLNLGCKLEYHLENLKNNDGQAGIPEYNQIRISGEGTQASLFL